MLKRGWQTAKVITALDSQPVGLVRREKNVTVATMDNCLLSINNKVMKMESYIAMYKHYVKCCNERLFNHFPPLKK